MSRRRRILLFAGEGGGGPAAPLDLSGGTNIGDLTVNGDLPALFDLVTSQDAASSAAKAATNDAYGGKTLAAPARIESATIFGSNNVGYLIGSNASVTATLYGKQGAAPANSADGTQIGQLIFNDTLDERVGRLITSTDTATVWDHVWVRFQNAVGGGVGTFVAEIQLTGWE